MSRALHTVRCKECGSILAYSLQPQPTNTCYCQLCMQNYCNLVDLFAIPDMPKTSDLMNLVHLNGKDGEIAAKHKWHMAVAENVNYLQSVQKLS